MKMTKLLASGVAAALATTSLAAVASAADRTFDMAVSYGDVKVKSEGGIELGKEWILSQADIDAGATLGISNDETITLQVSKDFDSVDYQGVTLQVTGVKGTRSSSSKTYTYIFDDKGSGKYELKVYGGDVAPADKFLPSQFVEITKVAISITGTHKETDQSMYNKLGDSEWGYWSAGSTLSGGKTGIAAVINSLNLWGANYDSKSIKNDYAFMPLAVGNGPSATFMRWDLDVLSYADAKNAQNITGTDTNQSYTEDGYNKGTVPKQFAGLASQVGDFFNKQTNGTITFKFTTATAATGDTWLNGGVPSTQVGLKNALGNATPNDFVLAFNYDQTGSLQAVAEVKASEGEVVFDISDVLDALDGRTIGVIDNIYYGLNKGVYYDDVKATGLKVEAITLSYDEDDASDNDIEEDDDDTDADDDEDDTDVDDDTDADDDDDTDADDDDDDDDGDVSFDDDDDDDDQGVDGANNTPVVDNTPSGSDDNPNTGVALAVVPAMVAAAAVVVSKKRK